MSNAPAGRVLVVDDDAKVRDLLCHLLGREGFEVECVDSGVEAIRKLDQRSYGLLFLDLRMPQGDGYSVIDYLEGESKRRVKPVVLVLSAVAEGQIKLNRQVVDGVIRKPFDATNISAVVHLYLDQMRKEPVG